MTDFFIKKYLRLLCVLWAFPFLLCGTGVAESSDISAEVELIAPGSLKVDGKLDEPFYLNHPEAWLKGFVQIRSLIPEPDGQKTRFRLFTDGGQLYFAAFLEEPSGRFIVRAEDRDGLASSFNDDSIELLIRTHRDDSQFLRLVVNAKGVISDVAHSQGGLMEVVEWDADAQAAVHKDSEGWSVELAVPLADLGIDPDMDHWFVQVIRRRPGRPQSPRSIASWVPVPDATGFNMHLKATDLRKVALPDLDFSDYGWQLEEESVRIIQDAPESYQVESILKVTNATGKDQNITLISQILNEAKILSEGEHFSSPVVQKGSIASGESLFVSVRNPLQDPDGRFDGTTYYQLFTEETLRSRYFSSAKVDYAQARLQLIEPGYRSAIFESQNIKQIRARLIQEDLGIKMDQISAKVITAHGITLPAEVLEEPGSEENREWQIIFRDLSALEKGEHRLLVTYQVDNESQVLERKIRILERREGEIWIDPRGVVYRDGVPFPAYGFVFGHWNDYAKNKLPGLDINIAGPIWTSAPFDSLKRTVHTLLQSGVISGTDVSRISKTALQPASRKSKAPLTPVEREEYAALARTAREIPGFAFYYLYDEPELHGVAVSRLREIYQILRNEDPWHPVIVLNNTVKGVKDYQGVGDIIMPDAYPHFIHNQGEKGNRGLIMGLALKNIKTGVDSSRAPWLTPQAFSFGLFSAANGRGPTAAEMRTQQVIGLIHGVTGFMFYPEYLVWEEPGVMSSLPYLSREFRYLFPYITEAFPTPIPTDQPHISAAWAQNAQGATVLMAANLLWKQQQVTLDISELEGISLWYTLGVSGTHLLPGSSKLQLTLQPFESVILSSLPSPENLDWTKVEEQEKEIIRKSVIPGNQAHVSTGTRAIGIRHSLGVAATFRAGALINGLKDSRAVGYNMAFKKGMGIELDFNREQPLSLVRLIDTNLVEGFIEVQTSEETEWIQVAKIQRKAGEDSVRIQKDIHFPLRTVRKLRIIAEEVKKDPSKASHNFLLREVEAYSERPSEE